MNDFNTRKEGHPSTIVFVFLCPLLLFSIFSRTFVWEWDGFGYIYSTVLHQRHALVTGRWGSISFMIPFWEFHKHFMGLSIENAWVATSRACIVAASLSVLFTFLLTRKLFGRTSGIMAAIFLASSLGWVSYASANTSEMVMIAFGTAGIYFLTAGAMNLPSGKISSLHLSLGSFLIGYAILAREQGLAYTPFALLLLLFYRSEIRNRYGAWVMVFPLIAVAVALSGPIYFYIIEGEQYLRGFHNPGTEAKTGWVAFRDRLLFLAKIWPYLFGLVPLMFSFLGLLALYSRREWRKLALILSLIAPAALHLFVGFLGVRYYLFVLPPLAILAAAGMRAVPRSRSAPAGVGLRHSSRCLLKRGSTFLVSFPRSRSAPAGVGLRHSFRCWLKRGSTFLANFPRSRSAPAGVGLRHSSRCLLKRGSSFLVRFPRSEVFERRTSSDFPPRGRTGKDPVANASEHIPVILTGVLVCLVFLFHAKPEIDDMNEKLTQRKQFAENLLHTMPEQARFILGHNDVMIDFYQQIGSRPNWSPMHFDWVSPDSRVRDIDKALKENHRIFIHPCALTGTLQDRQDLEKIEGKFVLSEIGVLSEIRLRSLPLDYEHKRQD